MNKQILRDRTFWFFFRLLFPRFYKELKKLREEYRKSQDSIRKKQNELQQIERRLRKMERTKP